MPKPIRIIAVLLLVAFSASLGTYRWSVVSARQAALDNPGILPVAIAKPLDVASEDTLRPGETLSQLLARAQLAEGEARTLISLLQEHQDPRRMRPGSVVELRRSVESGSLRRLDFRLDSDRTLSLQRADGDWTAEIEEVPVSPDTLVLAGVVRSSLYAALLQDDTGLPEVERGMVADILADRVFAWQVDFSRDLRRGDTFRVLYERMVRPDGTARSGRVISAQFNINNREYEAFSFQPGDGPEDYFDRSGRSLRRAFLRAPLQYRRISSAFSGSRFHPVLRVNRAHNGVDYAAASGTPVYAVGDGTVRRAGNGGGYGNVVEINHGRGFATRYAHLRGFASGIRAGVPVKQGDVIGYVGMTGLATGPHLHYEFHQNGRPIDPNSVQQTNGDPVPDSYMGQFMASVLQHVGEMDRVTGSDLLLATAPASEGSAYSD